MAVKKQIELVDLAAERAVLASLCQYGLDVLLDIDFVTSSHFNDPTNQVIYECIRESIMSGVTVELSAILSKANELGFINMIEKDEEIAFLRSLFNMPIAKANAAKYAAKLAKLKIIKDVQRTLDSCNYEMSQLTGNEEISAIMGIIENPIQDIVAEIYNKSDDKPVLMGEDVDIFLQNLKDNPTDMVGLSTGWPIFDKAIGGGLRRKCVDVIGARMKIGKSFIGEQVSVYLSKTHKIPVLMLDTEMDKEGHLPRVLANLSGITIDSIQNGQFGQNEVENDKVFAAGKVLEQMPFSYINVSGKSFDTILAIARQWVHRSVGFNDDGSTKDCLLVYDYLKMMSSEDINDSMKEYQALGFQITQLHNFCVKYDLPCLTFVQLNRDGVSKETTAVAADSDRILRYCTSFSIFKETSPEEQADHRAAGIDRPFNRKIVPVIARYGAGLPEGDYINMRFEGQIGRITSGPTRNQLLISGPQNDQAPTDISTV